MKRLKNIIDVSGSMCLFAVVSFILPFIASIWMDQLIIDVFALALFGFAHTITSKNSLRSAVIAQVLSIIYCLVYSAVLIGLLFFFADINTPGKGEVSPLFKIAAIPVVAAMLYWSIVNVVSINPFVKNRRIQDTPIIVRNENAADQTNPEKIPDETNLV